MMSHRERSLVQAPSGSERTSIAARAPRARWGWPPKSRRLARGAAAGRLAAAILAIATAGSTEITGVHAEMEFSSARLDQLSNQQVRVAATACLGDCDSDGMVVINELIAGVSIAL